MPSSESMDMRAGPEPCRGSSRVTVVIATRNRRRELDRTLRALAEWHPRSPVIVVDNASTDGTVEAVRRDFPAVAVLPLARNQGAAARNLGVARARTPYVAFSDDDSWWGSGALGRAAETLDAHPDIGLVTGRTLVGPEQRPDPVNILMETSPLPAPPDTPGRRVLGFLACSAVVRRDAFTAVGGFSRLLFFVGEETLLAYDLSAAGWDAVYVPDVVAHHHPSQSRTATTERDVLEWRNAVLVGLMRRPLPVATDLMRQLAVGAVRDPAARAALAAAVVRLPAALSRRGRLPPRVERDIRRLRAAATDDGVTRVCGPPPGSVTGTDGRISVAIMTCNRRDELLRTLRRMTALPEEYPIIVVDNGSSDGTASAVAENYPQVTLLRSERNLGAVARNVAVRGVSTPYVAFCDDDTWWDAGALPRAADLLDLHPDLGCVTGRVLVEPGGHEDPLMPEMRHSPVPGPSWLPGPALLGIMAAASVLRARAFWDAGGFCPRMWLGGEEELLTIDLAACGWWASWAADVVVHHEASAQRDPRRRRRLGIRNTLWTTWLRRPRDSALRRTVALVRSLPRDRASAAAVAEAVAGLPWVVRERRVVPPHVEEGLRLLEEPQRCSAARRYVDSA